MVNAENDNFLEVSDLQGLLETVERALAEHRSPEPSLRRGGARRRQMQRVQLVIPQSPAAGPTP
jgi:hypothetical protein